MHSTICYHYSINAIHLTVFSCRTFSEILHDSVQLENFEKFLLAQDENGAAPLEFWMTIEEFKTIMSDLHMRDIEAVSLQKKYFGPDADKGSYMYF